MHMRGHVATATVLWMAALTLWVVLIYFSFGLLIFLKEAQGIKVVHGAWLNAIVGTQSLVLLGAAVAHAFGDLSPTIFVVSHWLWGIGLGLYAIFVALLAYHLFFFDVEPDDLTPLLWIVMGAAAISTNAGSVLIWPIAACPCRTRCGPSLMGLRC
jgi:tellurite resistance protein TehA-like permease